MISEHRWTDYTDLIEGEPSGVIRALCLYCYQTEVIGRYVYENDPIEIMDGEITTREDWKQEAGRASIGKGKRRRFFCSRCGVNSDHVAVL